ncbi:MAG: chorismate mutase [Firmicutes bacterium]|nr:chorismate mutase [Bacillota bacterium]
MRELKEIRKEITEIDNKMAELFCRRMELVKEVAEYKQICGLPICDPEREAQVLDNGAQRVADPDMGTYYVTFLKSTMEIAKKYQADLMEGQKIAYCGTKGAFAYIAAKHLFPTSQLIAFSSFKKAYEAVEEGLCECAVLPVENSFAGDVGQVNDLMFSGPLRVNGMYDLAVTHDLLGIAGTTLSDIDTVVSHPQALSQCTTFIKEKGLAEREYSNTALAAEYVKSQNDKSMAAIGSAESAKMFGLEVIARSINDDRSNTTRFAVFSRVERHFAKDGGTPYFSLLFTARNEAGSLAQALTILGRHGFNMRTLRSRPMKDLLWNYYFYVEAEGDIFDENGQACIEEMKTCCDKIKIVGAYNNLQKQNL